MKNIIWPLRINAVLGLVIITVPFLGFPTGFKTVIFVIIGLVIIGASLAANKKASEYYAAEQRMADHDMMNN